MNHLLTKGLAVSVAFLAVLVSAISINACSGMAGCSDDFGQYAPRGLNDDAANFGGAYSQRDRQDFTNNQAAREADRSLEELGRPSDWNSQRVTPPDSGNFILNDAQGMKAICSGSGAYVYCYPQ